VVYSIKDLIGIQWKEKGRDWEGLDCYGLLLLYFKHFKGILLPDYQYESNWCKQGKDYFLDEYPKLWKKIKVPVKDSVLLFRGYNGMVDHTGIYIGKNFFIHSIKNIGVLKSRLTRWKPKLYGVFQYEGNCKV